MKISTWGRLESQRMAGSFRLLPIVDPTELRRFGEQVPRSSAILALSKAQTDSLAIREPGRADRRRAHSVGDRRGLRGEANVDTTIPPSFHS